MLHWGDFLVFTIKEFPCSALAFPGLLFSTGGSRAVGDSYSAIILKVKVSFNRFKKSPFIILKSNEKLRDRSIVCYGCLETNKLMIYASRFLFFFFLLALPPLWLDE